MQTEISQERGLWTSASNSDADLRCQGRHQAQLGIPEPEGTEQAKWAEGGNKVHDALAKQSTEGLSVEEVDLYDSCMAIEKELVGKWFGAEAAAKFDSAKPVREKRLWVELEVNGAKYKHSGQSDVFYRMGSKGLVIDYKTLTGDVPESPENMQLRDLAVLAWVNSPLLTEIAVAVIQPLVTHKPGMCAYSNVAIARSVEDLKRRVESSNNPLAPRTAGETQCKYCRAKRTCGEYAKWTSTLTPIGSIVDVPVASWTPEMRTSFLNNRLRAQKWLDECEAEMKRLLESDPTSVPGWKLKPGKVRETINNAQTVFDRCSKLGVSLEQFMGAIKVGKGDLKDALAAATKLKGKKLTDAMDEVTAGAVNTKQDKPSLEKAE